MYFDEITLKAIEKNPQLLQKTLKAVKRLKLKKTDTFSIHDVVQISDGDMNIPLNLLEAVKIEVIFYSPHAIYNLLEDLSDAFGDTRNGVGSIIKARLFMDEFNHAMDSKEAQEELKGVMEGFNRYTPTDAREQDLHMLATHAVNCCENNVRFRLRGIFKHWENLLKRAYPPAMMTIWQDQVELLNNIYE